MPSSIRVRLSPALFGAALLSLAAPAYAQSISLPQVSAVSRKQPLRSSKQYSTWINRADCLANDDLTFPVVLAGYTSSMNLQVWAATGATDCTQVTERQFGGTARCWLVYSETTTVQKPNVVIRAQDVVAHNTPSAAAASGTSDEVVRGSDAACSATDSP